MTRRPAFRATHEIVLTSAGRSAPRRTIPVMLDDTGHAWTAEEWRRRRGSSEWAHCAECGWLWMPRRLGLLSLPEGYTTMRVRALRGRR